jgi:hypothetical protein
MLRAVESTRRRTDARGLDDGPVGNRRDSIMTVPRSVPEVGPGQSAPKSSSERPAYFRILKVNWERAGCIAT